MMLNMVYQKVPNGATVFGIPRQTVQFRLSKKWSKLIDRHLLQQWEGRSFGKMNFWIPSQWRSKKRCENNVKGPLRNTL